MPTIVILHATPAGVMAAISAARLGADVVLLERSAHVGGLCGSGLGATDIATRGCTGGLFLEFVGRVRGHYVGAYGEGSQQVKDSSDGYHFEPRVAEKVLTEMLAEVPRVKVLLHRQFDAVGQHVELAAGGRIAAITVLNRQTMKMERYAGDVFIDATYEGDLAAAAGCFFRTRREGRTELNEPLAGKVYKPWGMVPDAATSTGAGDETIQAYNYRLCLTDVAANREAIARPAGYRREEYASLVEDVHTGRWAGKPGGERHLDGIGRVVNQVVLPNGKTDSNNQHLAFISTDLPEENYAWPTADWAWRDGYASRLREYTLGLLHFVQTDAELPGEFRERCLAWGLAKDEYTDNGNFPRQVYVREGRRIEGDHLFSAHDALPATVEGRPPVYADSVTTSHYAIDSHAHLKREAGRVHLDGFLSHPTMPYTVPYRVMTPRGVRNLLVPVAVSATHLGFGTLRMEPCWMALGQAAGVAAVVAAGGAGDVRRVSVGEVQRILAGDGAVLVYFRDAVAEADRAMLQRVAVLGIFPGWEAGLDGAASAADVAQVRSRVPGLGEGIAAGRTTRRELARAVLGLM